MRINSNTLVQAGSIASTGGTTLPDAQDTAFADKLAKATARVNRSKNSTQPTAAQAAEDAKLKAACKDMEAVFLNLMLTQMRKTVPKDGLLGNSSEEQMLTSMLDTETTKNMAQAGGMGLGNMLYQQLSKSAVKGQAVR